MVNQPASTFDGVVIDSGTGVLATSVGIAGSSRSVLELET